MIEIKNDNENGTLVMFIDGNDKDNTRNDKSMIKGN